MEEHPPHKKKKKKTHGISNLTSNETCKKLELHIIKSNEPQ